MDATYQIQEQEQAVLTTFGVPKAVNETGLHFKVPFVQQVQKVNTTIQGFPIGYSMGNNAVVENEGIMITSDYNFIDVDFFVEYRISEPVKYLYTSEQPEEILKNIAQSCIRTVIASYNVDEVLTTGKGVRYYPAFTDLVEFGKFDRKHQFGAMEVRFRDLKKYLDYVNGIVVNPFGFALRLDGEKLDRIEKENMKLKVVK